MSYRTIEKYLEFTENEIRRLLKIGSHRVRQLYGTKKQYDFQKEKTV